MTFDEFRQANMAIRGPGKKFSELTVWGPMQWGCALAGEVGEACNLLKKYERQRPGDAQPADLLSGIADELADSFIYLDLLAARLGIDLGQAVLRKARRVAAKRDVEFPL